jgi:hypothetical protein
MLLVLLIWVAVVFGICYLPEGLLTLEDVFVALLALLGAVADGVCLLVVRQFCCTQSCLDKKTISHHEIIAVLESDGAVEVGKEDELGVLEGESQRFEVGGGHFV